MRKIDEENIKVNMTNPFMDNKVIPIRYVYQHFTMKEEDGEKDGITITSAGGHNRRPVEATHRVNMFLTDDYNKMINGHLSGKAYEILLLIGRKLQWNQDLMFISQRKFAGELECSETTVARAILELVENRVLQKYKKGYYWINPDILFKGDRLTMYESFVREEIKQ